MLGVILGNIFPDADGLAVAYATLTALPTHGLHRTFTHSLFTVLAVIFLGYIIAWASKRPHWGNLGFGLGIGITMHVLLDLLIWFNGVQLLWPLPLWVNLWEGVTPPEWWSKLMMPVEFLFLGLYFLLLGSTARKRGTNGDYLSMLMVWAALQGLLFVVFLVLVYTLESGFMTPYGAIYLLSLGLAFGITLRMRNTVEAVT